MHPERGNLNRGNASLSDWPADMSAGHFNCWQREEGWAHCGWCHPWARDPPMDKEASQRKQASKQCFSTVFALVPALVSLLWWAVTYKPSKPFVSPVAFWLWFYPGHRNLTRMLWFEWEISPQRLVHLTAWFSDGGTDWGRFNWCNLIGRSTSLGEGSEII